MSRIEAKKLRIDLADTDLAALLRFVASHFSVLAVERRIQFDVDAEQACVAAVDPEKLQRVANAFAAPTERSYSLASVYQALN